MASVPLCLFGAQLGWANRRRSKMKNCSPIRRRIGLRERRQSPLVTVRGQSGAPTSWTGPCSAFARRRSYSARRARRGAPFVALEGPPRRVSGRGGRQVGANGPWQFSTPILDSPANWWPLFLVLGQTPCGQLVKCHRNTGGQFGGQLASRFWRGAQASGRLAARKINKRITCMRRAA